jgi:hypothetical protein
MVTRVNIMDHLHSRKGTDNYACLSLKWVSWSLCDPADVRVSLLSNFAFIMSQPHWFVPGHCNSGIVNDTQRTLIPPYKELVLGRKAAQVLAGIYGGQIFQCESRVAFWPFRGVNLARPDCSFNSLLSSSLVADMNISMSGFHLVVV